MNSINKFGTGLQLYNAQRNTANAAKQAVQTSFKNVLDDTIFAEVKSAKGVPQLPIPEPNTSLRWHTSVADLQKMHLKAESNPAIAAQAQQLMDREYAETTERMRGTIQVALLRNELVPFTEAVESGLANGESFTDIVQKWTTEQVKEFQAVDSGVLGLGNPLADLFFIDPTTGEIKHATCKSRHIWDSQNDINSDEDTAWDLAYDLQQFLHATAFRDTYAIPDDKVDEVIADVKARQANKNTERFDKPFSSMGYEAWLKHSENIPAELSPLQRMYYEKLGLLSGGSSNTGNYLVKYLSKYYDNPELLGGTDSGSLTDDFMDRLDEHGDAEYKRYKAARAVDVKDVRAEMREFAEMRKFIG